MMKEVRDVELGDAVNELDIPEYGDGFFERLRSQLDEETRSDASASQRHRSKRSRVYWTSAASTAVVAAAVAAVLVVAPADHRAGQGRDIAAPTTAPANGGTTGTTELRALLASEVMAKVTGAFESARSMQGTVVESYGPAYPSASPTRTSTFAMASDGSFRVDSTSSADREGASYDAKSRGFRSFSTTGGSSVAKAYTADVAGNGVDQPEALELVEKVVALAVPFRDAEGGSVERMTVDGRLVWKVVRDYGSANTNAPDRITFLVDDATGLPIDVRAERFGKLFRDIRFSGLTIDGPSTGYAIEIPKGIAVRSVPDDLGPKGALVDAKGARSVVGYVALLPTAVPEGFVLDRVLATPSRGSIVMTDRKIEATYRRGLATFTVTTFVTDEALSYRDGDDALVLSEESSKLGSGAFAGFQARVRTAYVGRNELDAVGASMFGGKEVLVVSGALAPAELLQVAASVQVVR